METCKINKKQIYTMLIACITPIVICALLNISLVYAFLLSVLFALIISLKNGFTIKELKHMILKEINECKSLYVVILLIGATVSVWLSSGVVPSMIFYGLKYMNGMNILFSSFLLIAISSVFMGTAVGTISTIGIAILGIGKGFEIPTGLLVGVIVSGAFLADKISPISGLLNLTLATTETSYKEMVKSSLKTIIPTIIICALIYYLIGTKYSNVSGSKSSIELMQSIKNEFFISPYFILVPVLIVILSIIGIKSIYCMMSGVVMGSIISIVFQNLKLLDLIKYIFLGFSINSNSAVINETLNSGGVISMISVVIIVMGAIALAAIMQGTGVINYLTKDLIYKIKNKKDLILKTGIISGLLTVITCDQTIGIVVPSRLLKNKYEEIGVDKSILARTISDTGTIIAPLMPWNVNGLIVSLVTGVSCLAYAPFALLCFIAPLMTVIVSNINKRK
ncbi:Na+/H+ antiporter NhaC family protein [Romboutsia lituseburensis]|uniref:Transporter, NhaC family n=1 Tax=Romboutsia lituseburensis DSM 797 TaxID=1121325 RepID=A0A1G9S521_9FIRM|nr:Na+/H+ antiporter NhaC family protein [Romboutsia lituseburensis]CEH32930.1 Malate-2H(+)/Na(+)-lactate antiporter [Romboutsia lituseburensis]SDM30407.1 transporter, NhaC family [Romboutsia lituseburensis DSM 797]